MMIDRGFDDLRQPDAGLYGAIKVVAEVGKLVKDKSRDLTLLGEFFIDDKGKSWLVRKAGETITPQVILVGDSDSRVTYLRDKEVTTKDMYESLVALEIYRELGLEVPRAKIVDLDGRKALAVEDMGLTKAVDLRGVVGEQRELLVKYYAASFFLNNPDFVFSLAFSKNGTFSLKDVVVFSDERIIFYSNCDVPVVGIDQAKTAEYEKYVFGKGISDIYGDGTGKEFENVRGEMAAKIRELDNKKIADIVLGLGVPEDMARTIIGRLWMAREMAIKKFEKKPNMDEALVNTPEWDLLDKKLEGTKGNEIFRRIAENAKRSRQFIEKVVGSGILKNEEFAGKPRFKNKQELEVLVDDLRRLREEDLFDRVGDLREGLKFLEGKRRVLKLDFLYKRLGYEAIEGRLSGILLGLKRYVWERISGMPKEHTKEIWQGLKGPTESVLGVELENFLSPTKDQVMAFEGLGKALNSEGIRDIVEGSDFDGFLGRDLPRLKKKRLVFKQMCGERSKVFVAHVTVPELLKKIVEKSALLAPSRLQERGERVAVNSPGGQKGLLAQTCFVIGGAALYYGGEGGGSVKDSSYSYAIGGMVGVDNYNVSRRGGFENSVAVVGIYADVVRGRKMIEYVQSGMGALHPELHVFDGNYTDDHKVGVEIPIDEGLRVLVPEVRKLEWEGYLRASGKTDEWIEKHLLSYPGYTDCETYVRYMLDPESVGEKPKPGIFVTDFDDVTPHIGLTGQMMFRWVSL